MEPTNVDNKISCSNALFRLKLVPPTGLKFDKLAVKFEEPGFDVFCGIIFSDNEDNQMITC